MHGARIVAEVVGDEATFNEWRSEMDGMASRIKVNQRLQAVPEISPCCLDTLVLGSNSTNSIQISMAGVISLLIMTIRSGKFTLGTGKLVYLLRSDFGIYRHLR